MGIYIIGKKELYIYWASIILLFLTILGFIIDNYCLRQELEKEKTKTQTVSKDMGRTLDNREGEIEYQKRYIVQLESLLDGHRSKILKVTAYLPTGRPTAFGNPPRAGIIAVSRDLFYYHGWTKGKQVYVEGKGIFEIDDLMDKEYEGKPIENAIDIYVTDNDDVEGIGNLKRRVVLLG